MKMNIDNGKYIKIINTYRNSLFEQAQASVTDRDEKLADINERIEVNMDLVGSTAIEDKL